jgi:hypothetical protein
MVRWISNVSAGLLPNALLGRYMFYAVNINTLQDVSGFPILIDGHNADSDPTRY